MDMKEIKGEDYRVTYNPSSVTVSFQGELSLGSPEDYQPIVSLLKETVVEDPETLSLDLRQLEFLNSAGISMLSKFVITLRKKENTQVIVRGSDDIPWQRKSLKNLQRLLTTLKLEMQ